MLGSLLLKDGFWILIFVYFALKDCPNLRFAFSAYLIMHLTYTVFENLVYALVRKPENLSHLSVPSPLSLEYWTLFRAFTTLDSIFLDGWGKESSSLAGNRT